jgi:hypothetical protein
VTDAFFRIFCDVARSEGKESAVAAYKDHVPAEKLRDMVEEYERLVDTVQRGKPGGVSVPGIEGWYNGPLDQDRNWGALKTYFDKDLGWSPSAIDPVDRASTKVIFYTPQPKEPRWTSKGLVVGYVQSGKTTNFTAVIAKAADLKYRLVIVLSGIHNGLRRQTQERLVTQLKAHNAKAWIELTTLDDDFREPTMTMASLLHNRGGGTALAVVKKNKAPLTRLTKWIQDAADQNALSDLPVLIIDDESDQASVATKIINPLIMGILGRLPRCTYIGYTATPFANVLIDPAAEDLYPANFILNLPAPTKESGYFGADRVFGRDAVEGEEANGTDLDGYDMVRTIADTELGLLRPLKRKDIADFEPGITESLADALNWFWLATAARRAREDSGHSSMLIHTHLSTVVHDRYKGPLVELRDTTLRLLHEFDDELIARLRTLWDNEVSRVPREDFADLTPVTFDLAVPHLKDVVAATKVIVDNSNSDDRLDYSEDSQITIAVGGNTLSRGLTLEGLVVSFFVRSSTCYDTLLQMARWFGYRRRYEDLPRIWMTETLQEWFRHLATVERELRLDIDRYEQQGYTPTQLGVRIRTHPTLAVTAKMGAAKPVAASFSDARVQTRYFHEHNEGWLRGNLDAADKLVRDARGDGAQPEQDTDRVAVLFRDVRVDRILQFLKEYRVHSDSPDLNGSLLQAYITKELALDKLQRWTVAVMSDRATPGNEFASVALGGIAFKRVSRAALIKSPPERADIKTLMSKEHRVVDLDILPAKARARGENDLVELRNRDAAYRDRGLLLLYPIDPKSEPAQANLESRRSLDAYNEVIGLGLVFPESSGSKDNYVSVDLSGVDIDLAPSPGTADADDEVAEEDLAILEEV